MKVTFFSSTLNHHQLPFSLAFEKILGKGNFIFVASSPITKEELKLGYPDLDKKYDFVLCSYESEENYKKAYEIAQNSDIIIFGSAPEKMVARWLKEGKIILRYSERIFKGSRWSLLNPRIACSYFRFFLRNNRKNTYLLCASAYAAKDYNIIGLYKSRCFKWGYFPMFEKYDVDLLLRKKQSQQIKLLWAGRFLDLKHPDKAIAVAEFLKKKEYDFHLDMIGTGIEEKNIFSFIEKKYFKDRVSLLGSMQTEMVRENMVNADIFLFTSDRHEGWGAVLNEAMNSGCAIVASYEAGSVPYLLKDGENGFFYKNNSTKELCEKVERLVLDKELREKLGRNAYLTIANEWNAENAARKLFELCNNLLLGREINIFNDGVLSKDEGKL